MQKLSYYKDRIAGLSDVRETVKVVEKKAASHIHLLKNQVDSLKSYREICEKILFRMSGFYWDSAHPLLKSHGSKKELIVITSDRGIVGGLYHNIIEKLIEVKGNYDSIIIVGKKGEEYLKEEGINAETVPFELENYPNSEDIKSFTQLFFDRYAGNKLGKLDVLYSQFFSLAYQVPKITPFLPFSFGNNQPQESNKTEKVPGFPIFEGDKKDIFNQLLRRFIDIYFSEVFWEAKLSEFSARTVEAENASTKTDEIIGKINLEFLKERRRNITQKQLESFTVHKNL